MKVFGINKKELEKMNAKQIFKVLSLVALILMIGACDNNEVLNNEIGNEETDQLVPMTFTAGMAQTRTELGGNIVNGVIWQAGDAISVLSLSEDGNSLGDYRFTTQDAGATATFTGQAQDAPAFLAVYPYREGLSGTISNINATNPKLGLEGLSLSADQQAVPGSFDPAQHFAVAYLASYSDISTNGFFFRNFCALVKFSIAGSKADDVKKVTLTANGGEKLVANSFSIDCTQFNYVATAQYVVNEGGSSSVSLTAKDGFFLPRTDYYFVVLPGTLSSGMKLTFEKADGSSITKTSTTEAEVEASRILNLGEFLLGDYDVFENTELINAINNSGTKVNWTVNEDGTVTLNEDNWAAMQKKTVLSLNNKELTDLSGIEYFTKLTSLECRGNNFTKLDLNKLTGLTSLNCSKNENLTELNVSSLTDLTSLNCSDCQLTSLDVSRQTKLTYLNCNYNQLVSLDVNTLVDLTMLYCYGNELTTLNVDNLTKLEILGCRENRLEALSIVNNTALKQESSGLLCGNQKDNITLTLTLTSEQEKLWNDFWKNPFSNGMVELNVVE